MTKISSKYHYNTNDLLIDRELNFIYIGIKIMSEK